MEEAQRPSSGVSTQGGTAGRVGEIGPRAEQSRGQDWGTLFLTKQNPRRPQRAAKERRAPRRAESTELPLPGGLARRELGRPASGSSKRWRPLPCRVLWSGQELQSFFPSYPRKEEA